MDDGIIRIVSGGLNGVGVLHYPPGVKFQIPDGTTRTARDLAVEISDHVVFGGSMSLPNVVDANGEKAWDFRVEGGWPGLDSEGVTLDNLRDLRRRVDEAIAAREASETGGQSPPAV
jgi:hypothetical protein